MLFVCCYIYFRSGKTGNFSFIICRFTMLLPTGMEVGDGIINKYLQGLASKVYPDS